jgi:hypothetical protein
MASGKKALGKEVQIGYKPETSRGTAEASASYYQPWEDLNWEEQVEWSERNQAKGLVEDIEGADIQQKMVEVTFTFPLTAKTISYLLYAALGAKSTTNPAGSVYKHTLTVAQDIQIPSFTWFIHDPAGGQDLAIANGVVQEITISHELNDQAKIEATVVGLEPNDVSLSPSSSTFRRFNRKHATFKRAGVSDKIKSFELNITRDSEPDNNLGSVTPDDFLAKELSVTGTYEILRTDTNQVDDLTGDNKKDHEFDLINEGVDLGSGEHPFMKLTLRDCYLQSVGNDVPLDDKTMETVDFKATYDDGNSEMIKAETQDDNSTLD